MPARIVLILMTILVLSSTSGAAQFSAVVEPDGSPLRINPGMTVKQAIQALKPEYQTYALGGDSGWLLQIHDNASYEDVLMTLWSSECQDYAINYAAKVDAIMIHSPKYKTKEGVHVGMLLGDVERKLGKLKRIYTSEPTFEQYAEFTKVLKGIGLGVEGGILEEGKRETQRYSPDAHITKLQISDW